MALEIRPYREGETEAFYRVPAIVFAHYRGQTLEEEPPGARIPPEWSLCAFEDGELATTYGAFPFQMRLNGAKAPAAGVTFVGTLPWFRRRGHLRRIMEHDFRRRYEQRMEPIAILTASIAAIYHRFGYAVCSATLRYNIEPRYINFVPSLPRPTGSIREASPDELPLLQQLYRDFSAPRNGYLHRAPMMWEAGVLGRGFWPGANNEGGPSLLAVYEEQGVPLGYVAYAAKHFQSHDDGGGPGQRVFVRDWAWKTPAAYRALWEFFLTFDLAARVVVPSAPVDDPAFDVMLDPRELRATSRDHLMGRVIDVERALPIRPYGAEGRVVFEVHDDMCPWNEGRWALDAGRDGAHIARTNESPQLTLDVSGLAQILFGQVSPSQAARIGRAEAVPDAPLALWDTMWRTEYAPYSPDAF